MEKRTTESPMDFEWQTRAPGDVTSPFYQLSMQHENEKKRPHSVFDSPTKKPLPALREPNSQQTFLFSKPTSPSRPDVIFGKPAFTTPRKFDVDFSSGAETSPENNADNDETPEPLPKKDKEKRNSLFGLYGRFAPSPGRGEIPRLNHYSNALARRVQKRRRRELDRMLRRDSDDDSDRPSSSEGKPAKQKQQQQQQPPASRYSSFADFFALLEAHPNVPAILSWWAQLVVNLSLFSLTVYVVFSFVSAIRAEFDHAAAEVSDSILAEMAVCAKNYVDNKCGGGDRLPALETVCENWERCMNRDPAKVGRAKVSAQTMALIINSFIDPISWKAILCFLATISTVTVVSNWSFRSFRNRLHQQEYMHPHPMPQPSHQPHQPVQHQPLQFPSAGNNLGLDYSKVQTRSEASPMRQHSFEQKKDEHEPLMLEDTPSRSMEFVTERSREREQHLRTPSPSKSRKLF
ncbi:hypothetical protein VTN77DRAFT_9652 [Rasamsonia byssochlamydoides]|uniref:uncharacterized protein n=1 Tax=Rasamsonia byssochlamydoides TaxID=89139 RepID=UPI003742CCE1